MLFHVIIGIILVLIMGICCIKSIIDNLNENNLSSIHVSG